MKSITKKFGLWSGIIVVLFVVVFVWNYRSASLTAATDWFYWITGKPFVAFEVTDNNADYLANRSYWQLKNYLTNQEQIGSGNTLEFQNLQLEALNFEPDSETAKPSKEPELAGLYYQLWLVYRHKGFDFSASYTYLSLWSLAPESWSKKELDRLLFLAKRDNAFGEFLKQEWSYPRYYRAKDQWIYELFRGRRYSKKSIFEAILISHETLRKLVRVLKIMNFVDPTNIENHRLIFADILLYDDTSSIASDNDVLRFAYLIYDRHGDQMKYTCLERLGVMNRHRFLRDADPESYAIWERYCTSEKCQISDDDLRTAAKSQQTSLNWKRMKIFLEKMEKMELADLQLLKVAEAGIAEEENRSRLKKEEAIREGPQKDWESKVLRSP